MGADFKGRASRRRAEAVVSAGDNEGPSVLCRDGSRAVGGGQAAEGESGQDLTAQRAFPKVCAVLVWCCLWGGEICRPSVTDAKYVRFSPC